MYLRVFKRSNNDSQYLLLEEGYRENGKVKKITVARLGRYDIYVKKNQKS